MRNHLLHRLSESVAGRAVTAYASAAGTAMAETLWPTRCAVCDAPGEVLCAQCRARLPYIDQWLACPRCGAPFGRIQCTECNEFSLKDAGLSRLPWQGCVCAVLFNDEAARVVRIHKDQGERRLAWDLAHMIGCAIPPEWIVPPAIITFIPASAAALRRRGFDHGEAIAQALSGLLGVPYERLLSIPRTQDQRELSRAGRFANMEGAFAARPPQGDEPAKVVVVDDVLTTGATMCAATIALLRSGFGSVRCAGFARVY